MLFALTLASAIGSGLIGGLLLAFSVAVMWNHLRTAASAAASASFTLALRNL